MEVRVYLNMDLYVERKYVYCQRVNVTSGVSIPYETLEKSLRYLYGNASVVEFISLPNL